MAILYWSHFIHFIHESECHESLVAQIPIIHARLVSVSRLAKFQAFISGHQSDFEIFEVSSYLITLFYTFMESHDDYACFHGSVAQFQHLLAEICVIEICLSSSHSFQDNNLILQCCLAKIQFVLVSAQSHHP